MWKHKVNGHGRFPAQHEVVGGETSGGVGRTPVCGGEQGNVHIPLSVVAIDIGPDESAQGTVEALDQSVGAWMVWGGPGLRYFQKFTGLSEQIAFKVASLVAMYLKGSTKTADKLMNEGSSNCLCGLIGQRKCLNPSREVVHEDKEILFAILGQRKRA